MSHLINKEYIEGLLVDYQSRINPVLNKWGRNTAEAVYQHHTSRVESVLLTERKNITTPEAKAELDEIESRFQVMKNVFKSGVECKMN